MVSIRSDKVARAAPPLFTHEPPEAPPLMLLMDGCLAWPAILRHGAAAANRRPKEHPLKDSLIYS